MSTTGTRTATRIDQGACAGDLAALDPTTLRQVLGHFATGVAVVTCHDAPEPVGITISSFNSVSMDPPLVLFSIDRRASGLPALAGADGYAINILARQQAHLSQRFSRARDERWNGIDFERGHANAPLLDGVLARFECVPYASHDGGDHVIFVGRVVRTAQPVADEPLVFFRGRYHSVVHEPT